MSVGTGNAPARSGLGIDLGGDLFQQIDLRRRQNHARTGAKRAQATSIGRGRRSLRSLDRRGCRRGRYRSSMGVPVKIAAADPNIARTTGYQGVRMPWFETRSFRTTPRHEVRSWRADNILRPHPEERAALRRMVAISGLSETRRGDSIAAEARETLREEPDECCEPCHPSRYEPWDASLPWHRVVCAPAAPPRNIIRHGRRRVDIKHGPAA